MNVKPITLDHQETWKMETWKHNAVIEMFRRSEEKYGAKISNYIGDRDSRTYGNLVKSKLYGENFTINKKECVGHVQKRMKK